MVRGFHFHPYLYGSEIPDIYSVYTQDTASQRKCTYIQTLSRRTWTILEFPFQCRYYTWGCSTCVSRGRLSFPFQWRYTCMDRHFLFTWTILYLLFSSKVCIIVDVEIIQYVLLHGFWFGVKQVQSYTEIRSLLPAVEAVLPAEIVVSFCSVPSLLSHALRDEFVIVVLYALNLFGTAPLKGFLQRSQSRFGRAIKRLLQDNNLAGLFCRSQSRSRREALPNRLL
jgi:hypothetical protein